MEEIIKKADVLIEALPYIRRFQNKIVVIKYGGSILDETKLRKSVLEDIVFLSLIGLNPVLVHGGGLNISERMRAENIKTEFVEGMRVTDKKTLRIVEEELEKLNLKITEELESLGGKAMGVSGKENIIFVEKKKSKKDLGLVGDIIKINTEVLRENFSKKIISVICPMGIDKKGQLYNVNADEVASSLASELQAEKLVILTNVLGIMRNQDDPSSLISTLNKEEALRLIKEGVISEGMIPKIRACLLALEKDVKKTHIIDARIPHALLLEIFTDKGIGTEIVK